ncbi:selenocysteine-specific translation elongation factor [candidate division LCP-89 bacterium B3_LCP]|uniref:Selenocysteine-specific elongation factor n=1 Tax=candidate division LCP-89 bacterium B3_LCP TaxID=2012998 RepID=A0A532V1P9_UNCL8|nr:MAG: selenocysteine-specific translation elongation factor [candidate division LCP-89 bacterium B3_LCP]
MSSSKRHTVIATAGHIDHGKTTLVRALTGMETDQLEEEKRRGITIELGFAFLGDDVTIIDVPGHEKFIKTMVAGVSTVDLALLVIAADDVVMPQTKEHLAILYMLGVEDLFVVITKIEDQNSDWLDLVEEDVLKILPQAYKKSARFFRCDSITGDGIENLKRAIIDFAGQLDIRPDSGVFRYPVDRAFSLKGYGTVVTGTILGGSVRVGDRLQVMPQGFEVRVRGLQSHGSDVKETYVGVRTAMNVIGSDVDSIHRGDWICEKSAFQAAEVIDVSLTTLDNAPTLKNRDRIRFHIGTSEVIGRVVLFGKDLVQPGEDCFAQVILEQSIMATRGDRLVIRRYSPLQTIGGGRVLDPVPDRKRRSAQTAWEDFKALDAVSDDDALELKINISGKFGLGIAAVRAFSNSPVQVISNQISRLQKGGKVVLFGSGDSGLLVSAEVIRQAEVAVTRKIGEYHKKFPQSLGIKQASLISELSSGFPAVVLEYIVDGMVSKSLLLDKGYLRRKEHSIRLDAEKQTLVDRIHKVIKEAGFSPPDSGKLQKLLHISEPDLNRILDILFQQGKIVRMADGTPWDVENVRNAWDLIHPYIASDDGKTVSQVREVLGCQRKHTVSLLEYFDREGLTDRIEDLRFPGVNFRQNF